jgi:hypothetical protein
VEDILFVLSFEVGCLFCSTANILPFDSGKWFAFPPNGRLVVRPHYNVGVDSGLFLRTFGKDLDGHFDSNLADIHLCGAELWNQMPEHEQVHNVALSDVPRSIRKIGQ